MSINDAVVEDMVGNYLLNMIEDMEKAGYGGRQVAAGLIGTLQLVLSEMPREDMESVAKAAMESLGEVTGWNIAIVEIKPTGDTLLH